MSHAHISQWAEVLLVEQIIQITNMSFYSCYMRSYEYITHIAWQVCAIWLVTV